MTRPALRRFGQNFLVDRVVCERIVAAVNCTEDDCVVEIGPGRGALTGALASRSAAVSIVEVDRGLARDLRVRFRGRVQVIEGDVLDLELANLRQSMDPTGKRRLVVVGNLPYNISKPIAMKLIVDRQHVDRAVLMFQREVARRLTASPGGRNYGPLSVLAGEAFTIEALFDVPANAFRPRPAVVSTVTAWRPRPAENLPQREEAALRDCLRVCFARRRQTLRNNLRAAMRSRSSVEALLEQAAIDGATRAEDLTPADLRRLAGVMSAGP